MICGLCMGFGAAASKPSIVFGFSNELAGTIFSRLTDGMISALVTFTVAVALLLTVNEPSEVVFVSVFAAVTTTGFI